MGKKMPEVFASSMGWEVRLMLTKHNGRIDTFFQELDTCSCYAWFANSVIILPCWGRPCRMLEWTGMPFDCYATMVLQGNSIRDGFLWPDDKTTLQCFHLKK